MISERKRTILFSALMATPPVVLVAAFCNYLLPSPEPVPAVVGFNDERVDIPHEPKKLSVSPLAFLYDAQELK